MAYVARGGARILVAALVFMSASLAALGCGEPTVCNCPDAAFGMVVIPGDSSRPVGALMVGEIQCVASDNGAVTGGRQVIVSRSSTGTCHVRAEFNDGTAYTFTVDFQSLGSCCSGLATAVGMSVPQPASTAGSGSM